MLLEPIIWPEPGRYVLAVSGGVDSMCLLHLFAAQAAARGYELLVAHFDHAMRPDSAADASFVVTASDGLKLPVVTARSDVLIVSEDQARQARYRFLTHVCNNNNAQLITAHHQDDLIETSLLNLTRGSGWEGLVPFRSRDVIRPFTGIAKDELMTYGRAHGIEWREDGSNANLRNPRNLLRRELMTHADDGWRRDYLAAVADLDEAGSGLRHHLAGLGQTLDDAWMLDRGTLLGLSGEALAAAIVYGCKVLSPHVELKQRLVAELALFARTGRPGKQRPIRDNLVLTASRDGIAIRSHTAAQNGPK